MKLLFDHNLSPRLPLTLANLFPGSAHVFGLGLHTAADSDIRDYAAANDFVIVTKDADFSELHALYGSPPCVVWIRRGNCSTKEIASILSSHSQQILQLGQHGVPGTLIIY